MNLASVGPHEAADYEFRVQKVFEADIFQRTYSS